MMRTPVLKAVVLTLVAFSVAGCQRSAPKLHVLHRTDDRVFIGANDTYYLTCLQDTRVFVMDSLEAEAAAWKRVDSFLPGKGQYYLDGNWVGYGMCDVAVCTALDSLPVSTVTYEKVGQRVAKLGRPDTVPAFQSVPLQGKIKVEMKTFPTSDCKDEQVSKAILTLNR